MATQTLITSGNKDLTGGRQEETALAPIQPAEISPMQMIQSALERGASMEQINQLLDLKDRIEAKEAEKAFVAAMSAFKACNVVVTKDKKNKQYGDAPYTSLGNLVRTVTPFLSQNNLSAGWDIQQSPTGMITVTCSITHAQGFSKSVSMTGAPDKSGAKNPIQEIKSTITYLKACTYESVTGLAATEEANLDDDGNGAGKSKPGMDGVELDTALENIANAAHLTELKAIYERAYTTAQNVKDEKGKVVGDKEAIKKLIAAK